MRDHETDPYPEGTKVVVRIPEDKLHKVYWNGDPAEAQLEPAANWYDPNKLNGQTGTIGPQDIDRATPTTSPNPYRVQFDFFVKNFIYENGNYIGTYEQWLPPEWLEEVVE